MSNFPSRVTGRKDVAEHAASAYTLSFELSLEEITRALRASR